MRENDQKRGPSVRWPGTALLCFATVACGGGGGGSTGPASPTPPADTYSVQGVVYFDENRNNVVDPDERIRFGEVEVEIAGRTGVSEASTGRVTVQGVPAGSFTVGIRTPSLPPFYIPGGAATVTVPGGVEVSIPVALPIGSNVPFEYLVSGDSISQGQDVPESRAYRNVLQARLAGYYARTIPMFYRGGGGGTTENGAIRIGRDLQLLRPSFTLIAWGTNDWNVCPDPVSCFTVSNLRAMVREVKSTGSYPVVATILPANVGYDAFAPASRNVWVARANELIRAMAKEEDALLVDTYAAFMRAPDLSALFVDHVHPNPAGHQLMAEAFFNALTKPRSVTASEAGY
jgi:lysophospholipase L1-like esterase